MTASPLEAALERLLELHPRRIDLSLGRIERLLAALGHPERRLPATIHIAGTNGKGSTAAFLRAMLEAGGARVHVYTSPHLVRFNERIRLAGALVTDAALMAALERCLAANGGQTITFFEITTAAAFLLFAETPADWLVLETGLGGRVDATNVLARPAACAITPVSMDHAEFLGADVAAIAGEKAGIVKAGVPLFVGPQASAALRVIEGAALRAKAPMRLAGRDFEARPEAGRLIFEDGAGLLDLPAPRLVGAHQFDNAGLAIATLRAIAPTLPAEAMAAGVRGAIWPARLQPLTRGRLRDLCPQGAELWLDGGHNPDGARAIAAAMGEMETREPRPLVLVCGMLAGKDVTASLGVFKGLAREIVAVPVSGDHMGRAAADVAGVAAELGFASRAADSVGAALRDIAERRWPAPPRILIWGSLYLAGAALAENETPPA